MFDGSPQVSVYSRDNFLSNGDTDVTLRPCYIGGNLWWFIIIPTYQFFFFSITIVVTYLLTGEIIYLEITNSNKKQDYSIIRIAVSCSDSIVLSTKGEKRHFFYQLCNGYSKKHNIDHATRLKNQRRVTSRFLRDLLDPRPISDSGWWKKKENNQRKWEQKKRETLKNRVRTSYKYLISTSRPRLFCNTVIMFACCLAKWSMKSQSQVLT